MREALLVALALAVVVLTTWCSWRYLVRRPGRCSHVRYRGRADVVCLACHRERERIAGHLQRVTRSAR